jgi:hypothetical protein
MEQREEVAWEGVGAENDCVSFEKSVGLVAREEKPKGG